MEICRSPGLPASEHAGEADRPPLAALDAVNAGITGDRFGGFLRSGGPTGRVPRVLRSGPIMSIYVALWGTIFPLAEAAIVVKAGE